MVLPPGGPEPRKPHEIRAFRALGPRKPRNIHAVSARVPLTPCNIRAFRAWGCQKPRRIRDFRAGSDFCMDFRCFSKQRDTIVRPERERGDRDALPPQTPGVGRAAAEQGRGRSYGLAVSILARLSPLSPCCSSWSWRSCSRCSACSRCSCGACSAQRSLASRAPRSMIARFNFGGFFR